MRNVTLGGMQRTALIILVLCVCLSAVLFSPFTAWSVFAGGFVVIANFWFAKRGALHMSSAISRQKESTKGQQQALAKLEQRGYLLGFFVRIIITGIVLLILINWQLVNIFGLLLGLSTVVATFMAVSLFMLGSYMIQWNQGRK